MSPLLYYIGAKVDGGGGDSWSYKTCKAPVKLSPSTNQYPTFYKPDAILVAQPTKTLKEKIKSIIYGYIFSVDKKINQNPCSTF